MHEKLVLVITCLGGRFGKNHEGDLSQKQQTIYIEANIFSAGNCKSASGQLQNDSVNGAMLITIGHVIKEEILRVFRF